MTSLKTEPYLEYRARQPQQGRHILAQFDEEAVVVYQAYRPDIGHFAAEHGDFGGAFSLSRMSWIKTNFLWMMYRSGWGSKVNQEVTLAIWLRRAAFEEILAQAVHSTFVPAVYADQAAWRREMKRGDVRLQWDPDHAPSGGKLQRRAIQLGLRGEALERYAREWILEIEDISEFVAAQAPLARGGALERLVVPSEEAYPLAPGPVFDRLGLTPSYRALR